MTRPKRGPQPRLRPDGERTYGAMTNDVLISIPLFVLMGYVMERGALVDKMFYSIQLAFRRVPASLAVATLIVCTFWGIASGWSGGGGADGRHRLQSDAQGRLRRQARRRRDHRRRHAGHPDPAIGDDHRLCRGCRPVGGEALCRGDVPRLLPGIPLSRLYSRLGPDQSEDRSTAAGGADARAGRRNGCGDSRLPILRTCSSRWPGRFLSPIGGARSCVDEKGRALDYRHLLQSFLHRPRAAHAGRAGRCGRPGGTSSSISRQPRRRGRWRRGSSSWARPISAGRGCRLPSRDRVKASISGSPSSARSWR